MLNAFGVDEVSKANIPVFHGTTKAGAKAIKRGKFISAVGRKRTGSIKSVASQPHKDFRPEGIYTTASRSTADHYSSAGRSPVTRNMSARTILDEIGHPYRNKGRVLRFEAEGKKPLYTDESHEIVFDPKELGKPEKTYKTGATWRKTKAGGKKYTLMPKKYRGDDIVAVPRKSAKKFNRTQKKALKRIIATGVDSNKGMKKLPLKQQKKMSRDIRGLKDSSKVMDREIKNAPHLRYKTSWDDKPVKITTSPNLHPKLRKKMVEMAEINSGDDLSSKQIKRTYRRAHKAIGTADPTVGEAFGLQRSPMSKRLPSALREGKGMAMVQRRISADPVARKDSRRQLRNIQPGDFGSRAEQSKEALQITDTHHGNETAYVLSRLMSHDRGKDVARMAKSPERKKTKKAGKGAAQWRKDAGFKPAGPYQKPYRWSLRQSLVEQRKQNLADAESAMNWMKS